MLLVEGKQARKERRPHLHTDLIMEATAMRKALSAGPDSFLFFEIHYGTARRVGTGRKDNKENIWFSNVSDVEW